MESGDFNPAPGPLALFCNRLKRLQTASGISQASLARAAHLGTSQISDVLNGKIKRLPAWDVTSAMVRACLEYAGAKHRPVPPDLRDEGDWRRRHADLEHDLGPEARSRSRRRVAPGRLQTEATNPFAPIQPSTPLRTAIAPYWATVREIRQRTGALTGRRNELAEITSFTQGHDGYRWLVGHPWAGKTALLAEAVLSLSGECDVVCYFLSRREADADSSRFLAVAGSQLAYLLEEQDTQVADVHRFRALWQRSVDRTNASGRHLLLVVDGLDEDLRPPGLPSVAALLPSIVGGRAHVLISSRTHPELPGDIPVGHPLSQARPMPITPFPGAQELAALARQEIDDLLRRDNDGLAADVLGLLTAAAGPLSAQDLAAMSIAASESAGLVRIHRLLTDSTARSLQTVGSAENIRFQFAHESLFSHAQSHNALNDLNYRTRIHRWADRWRECGWPAPAREGEGTPLYLLEIYPSTLTRDPQRLAELTTDISWIEAAIQAGGIDRVLVALRQAAAASPADTAVAALLAVVTGQAMNLRSSEPLGQPGYIMRQLWMRAAESAENRLASDIRSRVQSRSGSRLMPLWTTRRDAPTMTCELGRFHGIALGMAGLADGRLVTGGNDKRVLIWDPATPGADPVELGRHGDAVQAVTVLADGRVLTGGYDGRVLIWDPAAPGADPVELGREAGGVRTVGVLADGRVLTGSDNKGMLLWDPASCGADPVDVGRYGRDTMRLVVLPDGRIVFCKRDGQVLMWDVADQHTAPIELGRHESILAEAVLPNGWVVTGGGDGRVLVWFPTTPGRGPLELGRHGEVANSVAALPDGRIVSGGFDMRVLMWNPSAPGEGPAELGRHEDMIWTVAVLADGRVASGDDNGRMLVWEPTALRTGPAEADGQNIKVVALTTLPDRRMIIGSQDGRVLTWDLLTPGSRPAELGRHDNPVWAVKVLPGGRAVTTDDDRVLVWNPSAPSGAAVELGRIDGGQGLLAVLPDGRVVTGNDGTQVLIWDPSSPRSGPIEIARRGCSLHALGVLADGRVATGWFDGRVLVWDPSSPRSGPAELGKHDIMVVELTELPDGRLAARDFGGHVLLWDPSTPNSSQLELGGHDVDISRLTVLADERVATGGQDGRVLLWNPSTPNGSPVELGRHGEAVTILEALPNGRVVTGEVNGGIRVWDPAVAGTEVARLKCRAIDAVPVPVGPASFCLVIVHEGGGMSIWSAAD